MTLDTYIQNLSTAYQGMQKAAVQEVNRIADRHLARCKKNTDVGDNSDSSLRNRWDRGGVRASPDSIQAEVFHPAEYASFYEFGHRQTPGNMVFIELQPGGQKYGIPARQIQSGPNAGKWGIFLRLQQSYVKGSFAMTNSESLAQRELDAAARRMETKLAEGLR